MTMVLLVTLHVTATNTFPCHFIALAPEFFLPFFLLSHKGTLNQKLDDEKCGIDKENMHLIAEIHSSMMLFKS